ncbi:GNAT family N-acetyltransferase [Deinococcus sp. QL22]|uniref:GNAT family N-acetyltransferase n=1 Tax=Deinococcus sp. QL22 TaxID=2939437 RepID=UPI0020175388|nr:GNAT family N-acetyltransferase [Deinococcus sp. QL22]UQN04936.1 GNAT family N-acetyltransferase [Deinococcus sp. QL22]
MLFSDLTLTPELQALLRLAMFPDPQRVAAALTAYANDPTRLVFDWSLRGQLVSAAGVQVSGNAAEVLHIGTAAHIRGQGYGRDLLHGIRAHLGVMTLSADTDGQAVDFYRQSGFEVVALPPAWGTPRFRCTLSS